MSNFRRQIIMGKIKTQYTILTNDLKNSNNWVDNESWSATNPTTVISSSGRCCYPIALSCDITKSYTLNVVGTGSTYMYIRCCDNNMNVISTSYNNGSQVPVGTYYVVVFYIRPLSTLISNYNNLYPYFTQN